MIDGHNNEALLNALHDPIIDAAAGGVALHAEMAAADLAARFDATDSAEAQLAMEELADVLRRPETQVFTLGGAPRPSRGCTCTKSPPFKFHTYPDGETPSGS